MKVIFIEDVRNIGTIGEIKDVKNGLATNYLIPKKFAIKATDANLKIWDKKSEALEAQKTEIYNEAKSLGENLQGLTLEFIMRAGEEDKLFGSVTSQNIADGLNEKGFDISRKDIVLDDSIKTLGSYQISIKIHQEVSPEITVNVLKKDDIEEEPFEGNV